MSDIRQNSNVVDLFNRVENPLSNGGKWAHVDSAYAALLDNGTNATAAPGGGGYGWSYWTPDTYDGDDAEAWGCHVAHTGPTIAMDVLLVKASSVGGSGAVDGYLFRVGATTGGTYGELYRLDNAGGTLLSGHIFGPFFNADMSLIRRNGGAVEGWTSNDSGASWTLRESFSDSNYTTGLKAGLGVFGDTVGFRCFGSGPPLPFVPQIGRRVRVSRLGV